MTDKSQADRTRLGTLLVERHLISEQQLQNAIAEQKASHKQLGEILVESNLVSSRQIRSLLRVQKRLRATILTSVLSVTPLALAGCGGGAGGSSPRAVESSEVQSQNVVVEQGQSSPAETTLRPESPTESTPSDSSQGEQSVSGPTTPNAGHSDAPEAETATPEAGGDAPANTQPVAVANLEISLPPSDQQAVAGSSVTLNVSAQGTGTLDYQWFRNGQRIEGAVLSSLTLNPVTTADAGDYTVQVSNDSLSETSDPATLTVEVDQEARLAWTAPEVREDGSQLIISDIQGYRVYHSTEDGALEEAYDLPADTQELLLSELNPGTHYFAVTTVDINGLESNLSNMLSKTIY